MKIIVILHACATYAWLVTSSLAVKQRTSDWVKLGVGTKWRCGFCREHLQFSISRGQMIFMCRRRYPPLQLTPNKPAPFKKYLPDTWLYLFIPVNVV